MADQPATLVLTTAAAATVFLPGGPVIAPFAVAAAAAGGQYLDRKYFAPPPPVEGPRVGDQPVTLADYGTPLSRVYGRVKLGGAIVWAAPLEERSNTQTKDGVKTVTYEAHRSLAVVFCAGPVTAIRRIRAGDRVIWDFDLQGDGWTPPESLVGRTTVVGEAPATVDTTVSAEWEGSAASGQWTLKLDLPAADLAALGIGDGDTGRRISLTGLGAPIDGTHDLRTIAVGGGRAALTTATTRNADAAPSEPRGGAATLTNVTDVATDGWLTVSLGGDGVPRLTGPASLATALDLPAEAVGATLRLAGLGAWDGDYQLVSVQSGDSRATLTLSGGPGATEGVTGAGIVTVIADPPGWGDPPGSTWVSTVNVYLGTDEQEPDAIIEGWEGAGNVPAFRGLCYAVLGTLEIGRLGGLPQITAEIEGPVDDVAGTLADLAGRSGLSAGSLAADAVSLPLRGYEVSGTQAAADALQPLALAYDLAAVERDGVVTFEPLDARPARRLDPDQLGAAEAGGEIADEFKVTRPDPLDLPGELTVTYRNAADADFSRGAESERTKHGAFYLQQTAGLEPLVLTPSEARRRAEVLLWRAHAESRTAAFTLPPAWRDLAPGDLVSLSLRGTDYRLRVSKVDRGANFLLEVEATLVEQSAFGGVGAGAGGRYTRESVAAARVVVLLVLDLPAVLEAAGGTTPGLVVLAARAAAGDRWQGASALLSRDGGITWGEATTLAAEAVVGTAVSWLPPGPLSRWDERSTVDVELSRPVALSSLSRNAVHLGGNRALLGGEILHFRSAEQVGPRAWRLSGLLRGRRDTAAAVSLHAVGEAFVLLDEAATWLPLTIADRDLPLQARGLPAGGDLLDAVGRTVRPVFANLRPFAPAKLSAVREENGDITVRAIPRVRALRGAFARGGLAPYADSGPWDFRIWDAAGRQLTQGYFALPSFTYPLSSALAEIGGPVPANARLTLATVGGPYGNRPGTAAAVVLS